MRELGFGGSVERTAAVATMTVHGEADLAARNEFQSLVDALLGAGTSRCVVDVTQLSYLESACLRILLHAHSTANAQGHSLVVHGASGIVERILEVAGVATILTERNGDVDRSIDS